MVVVWVYTERMFSPTRVKNLPWVMTPYLYNPSNVELPTNAQLSKTVWSMGAFVFNGASVSAGAGVAVGETVSAAGAVAGSTAGSGAFVTGRISTMTFGESSFLHAVSVQAASDEKTISAAKAGERKERSLPVRRLFLYLKLFLFIMLKSIRLLCGEARRKSSRVLSACFLLYQTACCFSTLQRAANVDFALLKCNIFVNKTEPAQ